jgi:hypothetical protein
MEHHRFPSAIPGASPSIPRPDSTLHRSHDVCVFCAGERSVEGGVCGRCRIRLEGRVRARNVWVRPITGGKP